MSNIKGPLIFSLDITNKCNYRCLHCYNNSGDTKICDIELSDDEVRNLVEQIIEMNPYSFCFCGGEPLLRKDLLLECLSKLTNNGINCAMVTNGFFLTAETAEMLKKSGISNVQISLDGTLESHNRLRGNEYAYSSATKALQILDYFNISSGIAFSPTFWNINDFEHVYAIGEKYNVKEIRLQELMPLGRAQCNNIIPSEEQYGILRKKAYEKNILYYQGKGKFKVEYGDPISHLIAWSNENKDENRFTESVSILADGSLTPSIYLPITIGNIRRHTLKEYWDNGYDKIWKNNIVRELAEFFTSVAQMENEVKKSANYMEHKLVTSDFDLIDLKVTANE